MDHTDLAILCNTSQKSVEVEVPTYLVMMESTISLWSIRDANKTTLGPFPLGMFGLRRMERKIKEENLLKGDQT